MSEFDTQADRLIEEISALRAVVAKVKRHGGNIPDCLEADVLAAAGLVENVTRAVVDLHRPDNPGCTHPKTESMPPLRVKEGWTKNPEVDILNFRVDQLRIAAKRARKCGLYPDRDTAGVSYLAAQAIKRAARHVGEAPSRIDFE